MYVFLYIIATSREMVIAFGSLEHQEVHWSISVLVHWSISSLEHQSYLVHRSIALGSLKHQTFTGASVAALVHWSIAGSLEHRQYIISDRLADKKSGGGGLVR